MGSWDYNHIILYFNNNKNIEGLVDQTMKCLDYEETDFSYLEEAGVYGPKWDYTYISRFNDELYYEQNFNNDTNQTLYLLNILFDEINIYTVEAMGSSTGDFYSSNEVSYDVIGGKCYNCSYYNKNISDINRNTFAFDLDLKLLEDVIDRAKEFGFSELVNIAEEKYKMIIDRKECIENGELIKVAASVEEYIVPECVTSIGNNAFDENKKLTKVVISDSVTDIGDHAFSNCENLANVVMSKNLKSIGESAFENCHSLTSIEIPDSVTKIENDTFCECKMLASIVMPKTLKSIGDGAFCCCSFTGIELPNSVTSIGEDAFCGCEKLVSVVMPKALTSIGNYAFECCSSLTSIEIPDSVKEIGESAFTDCSNLENVTLPKQINNIGKAAFENTKWINDLNENFVIVGDGILIKYKGNEKKINIPDTVKYIGDGVFEEAKITSIFLPDSIVDIGKNAFEKCNKLESINIPASVISIGENAFKSCSKLTDIVLPDSVVNIGSSAFEKCSKLKSINIPESVVSVGENAFKSCSKLTNIVLPDSVVNIGNSALEKWTKLEKDYGIDFADEDSQETMGYIEECETEDGDDFDLGLEYSISLSGTQYEGRIERIEKVKVGDPVELVREPDNIYDKNAIDVRNAEGSLGHLAADASSVLAPYLDDDSITYEAVVSEVTPLSKRSSRCKNALISIHIDVEKIF